MSKENVEIVRRIYAEFERGNFAAAVKWYDPEIRFETFMPDASENVTARGLAGLGDFMRSWFGQWGHYRVIGDEFREVGNDKVFVAGRQVATGHESGAEVESPSFSFWTFRSGKVVELFLHIDRKEALKAAGLSE
ncbi:MAG: nuclear transport factor 2 family protein [Solirubrobacterales bacterium]